VLQGWSYRLLDFISLLMHYYFLQHKTKSLVCTTKGINPLSGELQLASDLDFYIDGVRLCNGKLALLPGGRGLKTSKSTITYIKL